jgi:ubiquinone/menaquinone biosynthesis C-methylase UbiE
MAKFYDIITRVISQGGNKRSQAYFLKLVSPRHTVLNIGCGSVSFNIELAKHSKNVTSIDVAPKMIEIAKKKLDEKNITHVNFICSDIMNYISEQPFDIVFSNFFFNTFLWSDCQKVITKVASLVKKNGLLCIADEVNGSKKSTLLMQKIFRPQLTWLHHKWAKHPLHDIYDYEPFLSTLGFERQEEKRDRSDYILSSVYKRKTSFQGASNVQV